MKTISTENLHEIKTYIDEKEFDNLNKEVIFKSFDVSGTWTNQQLLNNAPDTTGLTFTAVFEISRPVYDPASHKLIPATYEVKSEVIPEKSVKFWTNVGMQDITFSYTFNTVTKTYTTQVEVF